MILLDANILMYAAGSEHPNRTPSLAVLRAVAETTIEAGIDAEILQEIIHRYTAIRRWEDGRKVYTLARELFPEILPITGDVLDAAKDLVDRLPGLMARDAVHAAVVSHYKLEGICTFDEDFERIPGCRKLDPLVISRRRMSPPKRPRKL